jgi:hypothetical protein
MIVGERAQFVERLAGEKLRRLVLRPRRKQQPLDMHGAAVVENQRTVLLDAHDLDGRRLDRAGATGQRRGVSRRRGKNRGKNGQPPARTAYSHDDKAPWALFTVPFANAMARPFDPMTRLPHSGAITPAS